MATTIETKIMNVDSGEIPEWSGLPAIFDSWYTSEIIDRAYREIAGAPSMDNPWVIVMPGGWTRKPSGYDF